MGRRTKVNPEMFNGWHEINGRMVLLKDGYVVKDKAKPMVATGFYINLWNSDNDYDVFIIINEANCDPDADEIEMIEDAIRPLFEEEITSQTKVKAQEILDNLDLECLGYGGQIVINK